LGTEKYRNEKGNAAKCPFSHKGKLFPAPGPETCGRCGSATETTSQWVAVNPAKDRAQLARLVVWFAEEVKEGHFKPIGFIQDTPEGRVVRAMVEYPWRMPIAVIDGVQLEACGWIDTVKAYRAGDEDPDEVYISDYKTTKNTLGQGFFAGFSPDIQVDLYDFAAAHVLPSTLPYTGVVIEGIQCLSDGLRFGMRVIRHTDEQRAEFGRELMFWLASAVQYAKMGYWPMNRASCKMCQFKPVCALPAEQRQAALEAGFERRRWNPMTREAEALPVRQLVTLREAVERAKLRSSQGAVGAQKEGAETNGHA
jgi:hypothetical protein